MTYKSLFKRSSTIREQKYLSGTKMLANSRGLGNKTVVRFTMTNFREAKAAPRGTDKAKQYLADSLSRKEKADYASAQINALIFHSIAKLRTLRSRACKYLFGGRRDCQKPASCPSATVNVQPNAPRCRTYVIEE
ncbi:hypothetical protein EGR_10483 [Echinococcus granulosus]|uniref:Uncharacterized protein n=1 Tax=Echinococcus granulosus TaxID=6210 RepID=W6U0M2_ECHGR|nr:hypothetical protein EGR_10483 [Echinococcus granulosus]EUB54665.1 hypothetical protein EGR_10483 [Echinococcus granulosus]